MRLPDRLLLAPLALLALAMAGCSGGSDSVTRGSDAPAVYHAQSPTAEEPDAVIREPSDGEKLPPASALALSAERIDEVDSFRGEFEMSFGAGGFFIGMAGEFAYRAPDATYMTMNLFGEEVEMIFLPPELYLRVPGEGWYGGSMETAGIEWEPLFEYVEQQGPFDYRNIADELHGVEQLPDETIDGVTYARYGGDLDLAKLYAELPEGLIDPATLADLTATLDTAHVDIWLHADTYLPYRTDVRLDLGGLADVPGGSFTMETSMVMHEYNVDVVIPDPPADFRPIELLPASKDQLPRSTNARLSQTR